MSPDQAIATRADQDGEWRERAEFFGPGPDRMLGLIRAPSGESDTGVVVCSPVKAERVANHLRELTLVSELVKAGHTCLRFHYRGDGQSLGDPVRLTIRSMTEDIHHATAWLAETTGVNQVALVGTRLGALAAADVSAGLGLPLAMWEPVIDPSTFFHEVARAKVVFEMGFEALVPGSSAPTLLDQVAGDVLIESMVETGQLDTLAFSIDRLLFEDTRGLDLVALLGDHPRPLFLGQWGARSRPDHEDLRHQLDALGFDVQSQLLSSPIAWWPERRVSAQMGKATNEDMTMVNATVSWLGQHLDHSESTP